MHLIDCVEDPIHGGDRSNVGAFVEQSRVDGRRRGIDEAFGVQHLERLAALVRGQRSRLGGGFARGLRRRRSQSTIVRGARAAGRRAGTRCAHDGGQLGHRGLDDHVRLLSASALSAASPSKSAESFD